MVGLCAPLASAPVSSCCFCHFFLSAWAAQTLGKQRLEVKCRLVWATPRPPNAASFCCVEQSAHSPWPLEAPDTGGHRVISGRYCGNYSTPTSLFYRLKVQSPRVSAASESSWSCTDRPASRPLPSRGAGASGGGGAAAWLPGEHPSLHVVRGDTGRVYSQALRSGLLPPKLITVSESSSVSHFPVYPWFQSMQLPNSRNISPLQLILSLSFGYIC